MSDVWPLVPVAGGYAWAFARVRLAGRRFPAGALAAFALGWCALAASFCAPLDARADVSLTWHMVQHLLLVMVAAPLLTLGAPVRLTLAGLPVRAATRLARLLNAAPARALSHPAVAWLTFVAVLFGAHFSPLYEAALEHPLAHVTEHALFLGSALIFWSSLLAVAPAPHAHAHPIRILALFLALPVSALLGFVFYVTERPIYPHYAARPGALGDQAAAGLVMWIAGGLPLFAAFLWCVADWGARERKLGAVS